MIKNFLLLLVLIVLFQACSTKKYFEPKNTSSLDMDSTSMDGSITTFNASGATLDNNQVITKAGVLEHKIPDTFTFLNYSDDKIIATNNRDKIYIKDKILQLNKQVVAASLKDELLAIILSNNTLELYNLKTSKVVFKEYLEESLVNDIRIANPIFMGDLVLFPSLNGKIIIVNYKNKKIVNSLSVDSSSKFNNLIYLDVINDNLIAATPNKIMTLSSNNVITKEFEIRAVLVNKEFIYLASNDGKILQLDVNLEILNMKKYKYAKFYTLAYGKNLYALESQDYLISISNDFSSDIIYDFSFDKESKVIAIKDTIYFDDEYIKLK